MTYAYTGDLLLPVTVTPRRAGRPDADPGACALAGLQGDLRAGGGGFPPRPAGGGTPAPSAQAPLFAAHDRAVPRPSPWQAQIAPDGSLWVQGPELGPATVTDAWFIPDHAGTDRGRCGAAAVGAAGRVRAGAEAGEGAKPDAGLSGILSVRDRTGLQTDVELHAVPGAAPAPAFPPLRRVLLFAFLGGLILNLMPCVFPVLAMKAVALAQGAARGEAGRTGCSTPPACW